MYRPSTDEVTDKKIRVLREGTLSRLATHVNPLKSRAAFVGGAVDGPGVLIVVGRAYAL